MAIQPEFQGPMRKVKNARNSSIKSRRWHPKLQGSRNSTFDLIKGHCMNPIMPQKRACSIMHLPKLYETFLRGKYSYSCDEYLVLENITAAC